MGRNSGGGRSRSGGGGGGGGNVAAESASLRASIASRPSTPVENLSTGDLILVGNNAARVDSVTKNGLNVSILNVDGSVQRSVTYPRFEGQNAQRMTRAEFERGQRLANQAGGGFAPYTPFRGLETALSSNIRARNANR